MTTDPVPWADWGTYFVPLVVEMAHIKAGDLEGWQSVRRVRVLADYHDAHGMQAVLGYDYATPAEVHSYTSAQVAALVVGSREQVRLRPGHGKCEAIQIQLVTTPPTNPQVLGTGRGAGFTGVALEIHQKKGGYRNLGAGAKS